MLPSTKRRKSCVGVDEGVAVEVAVPLAEGVGVTVPVDEAVVEGDGVNDGIFKLPIEDFAKLYASIEWVEIA